MEYFDVKALTLCGTRVILKLVLNRACLAEERTSNVSSLKL